MGMRKAINEEWVDIFGDEGRYFISNKGRVKSVNRILKQRLSKNGYWVISIRRKVNGKISTHLVHRLMASAFLQNPHNKPEVNHINGIKNDNRLSNLEWVTKSEQAKHAWDNELNNSDNHKRGEDHYKSILKKSDVMKIFLSKDSSRILAKKYGVSRSAIQHIKKCRSWKNITIGVYK